MKRKDELNEKIIDIVPVTKKMKWKEERELQHK